MSFIRSFRSERDRDSDGKNRECRSHDESHARGRTDESTEKQRIYRIPPYYYINVLNKNTNITTIEKGPQTYIRKDHEHVTLDPQKMVVVPPHHYCAIENPVRRDKDDNPVVDRFGQVKLQHSELEIRLAQDPFPLYPGEILKQPVQPLKIVSANAALRIRAILDFTDDDGSGRLAGDEWLFEGPGTYIPRKETVVVEAVLSTIIAPNQAIRIKARKDCVDREGISRKTGEEWLVKKHGAYLPGVHDEVMCIVNAHVLTDKTALHLMALKTFTDDYGIERKNGEEWLITTAQTDSHIPNVYERVVGEVGIISLTNRQYCVIVDPASKDGKPQLGQKKLVKGEISFFLLPGERLEKGIQNIYILREDEGLILRASEVFQDGDIRRRPGDQWMIRGPVEYVPPVEVEVVTKRTAIPLDLTEGIYVRNMKTGKIQAIHGQTYMLDQDEELWEKELPPDVEELLNSHKDPLADRSCKRRADNTIVPRVRDKTRVVTFRVPHNAAVQIYDYKDKKARVIFGPELVMLGPDEQFTQLSLSGGRPKKPNVIKALCLLLGPDFCTDNIVVETSDHAKLSIQLAYNWHFDVNSKDPKDIAKLFSIPDFIGDSCKAIASKVRGAVAQVQFDEFHKNSAQLIRSSVFGLTNDEVNDNLLFPQNNLVITSVDVQAVEPVDQRTRDALQKSVQLAIEITTKSQEATAKHEAERLEQEAKGRLERQKIMDEAEAEKARRELLELQSYSAAVESTGQAKAEAQSRAEAMRIEGEAAVDMAKLKAQAQSIEAEAELDRLKKARQAELAYKSDQNKMEIEKTSELCAIEVKKFQNMVEAIGSNTLLAMSTAGPDMQVRMLQALGLKSTLITDGSSPINLFNTASGLIGAGEVIPAKRRKLDKDEKKHRDDDDDDEDDAA